MIVGEVKEGAAAEREIVVEAEREIVVGAGAEREIVVEIENVTDRELLNFSVFTRVRSEAYKILELSFLYHSSEQRTRPERVWFISRDYKEAARFNIRKMSFEEDNVSRLKSWQKPDLV